jgi:tetratricopeptide (TPR) repeat protein
LYIRTGRVADRVFLSFDALAADLYWIRAIQHYGRDRASARSVGRFEHLWPLLEIVTTLDPHFEIAYRFGAIFLALDPPAGPGRPDQAIALLEKGLAADGMRWTYAHDIGFIHYWHTGRFDEAARWFAKALVMPGAPAWLGPLAATTRAQGGDRDGARLMLEVLRTSGQLHVRQAADRSLAQLRALDEIDRLQSAVERFHRETGRYPGSWQEIQPRGLADVVPVDPAGRPYVYDRDTARVGLSAESPLHPLPRSLTR